MAFGLLVSVLQAFQDFRVCQVTQVTIQDQVAFQAFRVLQGFQDLAFQVNQASQDSLVFQAFQA